MRCSEQNILGVGASQCREINVPCTVAVREKRLVLWTTGILYIQTLIFGAVSDVTKALEVLRRIGTTGC